MRIGKFTGTIYKEDYDFSQCPECCHQIPPGLSDKEISNLIDLFKIADGLECSLCMGCVATFGKETKND